MKRYYATNCGNSELDVQTQVPLPIVYDGLKMENSFRMALLVERKAVVELKSVGVLREVHHMQLLTYLSSPATSSAYSSISTCLMSKTASFAK